MSVEDERAAALDRLRQMQLFYSKPEAATLMQQMQGRASGADSPYTQQVQQGMFADNADASAGQVRSERGQIDRAFGNAGLSGSGLQASAHINSQRRASAMARQGRRDIVSRASLANFQARQQAQGDVQSYLAQQAMHNTQTGQAEVDFRSQAREVSDAPAQAQGGVAPGPQPNVNMNYGGPGGVAVQGPAPTGGWTGGGQLGLNNYNSTNQSTFGNPAQAAMRRAFEGFF